MYMAACIHGSSSPICSTGGSVKENCAIWTAHIYSQHLPITYDHASSMSLCTAGSSLD